MVCPTGGTGPAQAHHTESEGQCLSLLRSEMERAGVLPACTPTELAQKFRGAPSGPLWLMPTILPGRLSVARTRSAQLRMRLMCSPAMFLTRLLSRCERADDEDQVRGGEDHQVSGYRSGTPRVEIVGWLGWLLLLRRTHLLPHSQLYLVCSVVQDERCSNEQRASSPLRSWRTRRATWSGCEGTSATCRRGTPLVRTDRHRQLPRSSGVLAQSPA